MQLLALALPHLSPPVRAKARAHLGLMFASHMPLRMPVHLKAGLRREPYTLGPGMQAFAQRHVSYAAAAADVYALWAYAHYADAWEKVLGRIDAVRRLFVASAGRPVEFDPDDNQDDAAERLNARIAGAIACARILKQAGLEGDAARAMLRLAELVAERVHHERADDRLIRRSGRGHHSKVPRYAELTPELCAILRQHAERKLTYHVRGLAAQLPVWYQAYGERMIGGENYISPPHLSRGLFAALADGLETPADELARWLDHPWCKADLYYIEKLSAMLRRVDHGVPDRDAD
jgi:integrase